MLLASVAVLSMAALPSGARARFVCESTDGGGSSATATNSIACGNSATVSGISSAAFGGLLADLDAD
ncbi:hypothetical protein PQJ75_25460 [Rhodoplanes sp. TEM]|uniref:Uncharacterized protein n=1 Tax=Rhodoplanes tepidamans TaxID=200616 RepID=A0ABT5JF38_RHOTP|nr:MULTISPECIES: hypothetical protein [Rhodoplanes]MDC7788281.1 hypothetical protein [Rhodoplanes tepidamans]MDC7987093.1 hypothetical protein [Rhodoplanes sp. TEM]MDQ0355666.1 hypothetical protein [Rhodoplanes tepidamans]